MEDNIVILVDASGSIGSSNYIQLKADIVKLLQLLCPPNGFDNGTIHRLAAVRFSLVSTTEFDFDFHQTSDAIYADIPTFAYDDSWTNTSGAFNTAIELLTDSSSGNFICSL